MNFWDQIRNYVQRNVSQQGYENWLKGTAFIGIDGEALLVSVPDRETRTWLETEYASVVRNSIHDLGLPVRQIRYEAPATQGVINQALATVEDLDSGNSSLNPKF